MSTTSIRDVLGTLDFAEDWGAMTDEQPGYIADLGPIQITANEVQGPGFRPVMKLTGTARNKRSLKLIDFDMPLHVASYEQGVALIAYAVGDEYDSPTAPAWLSVGKTWAHHLPWAAPITAQDPSGVPS